MEGWRGRRRHIHIAVKDKKIMADKKNKKIKKKNTQRGRWRGGSGCARLCVCAPQHFESE